MGKIKALISLIKVSTKAQIISGALAVTVVGSVAVGGTVAYKKYQSNNESAILEAETINNRLNELRKAYNDKVKIVENLIIDDNVKEIKDKLTQFDKALNDKDIEKAEDLNTQLNALIEVLVKDNEEAVRKALEELKKTDISKYTDEMKEEFNNQILSLEALIEKGNYTSATKKVNEIKELIEANNKKLAEQEEIAKEEPKDDVYTSSNNGGSSNSGGSSNDGSSNSGGSSNGGSSNSGGGSSTETTPPTQPSGAVAPDGYTGGLMINWDLTNSINNGSQNRYRQGVNRTYFQRHLNGESISSILAEMQQSPYYDTINGVKRDCLAIDFKVSKTAINSNNVNELVSVANGLSVSLMEDPFRNKNYDYFENFVVYNGTTNLIYRVGIATIFVDPVE